MRRHCLPCLLALLLTSAALDDAWAMFTPDKADDAQAADDNEYVQAAPDRHDSPAREAPQQPGGPAASLAVLPICPPSERFLTGPPFRPALDSTSLYVFMSLQR